VKGEINNGIIELRDSLTGLSETQEKKEEIIKDFRENMEKISCSYRKLVNSSVITRERGKWIMISYWDERDGKEYTIEVFKNKMPTNEGLEDYTGYYVLLDGAFEKGSTVCRIKKVDWSQDPAPRHLWHYLNKIADDKGVEEPEEFEGYRADFCLQGP